MKSKNFFSISFKNFFFKKPSESNIRNYRSESNLIWVYVIIFTLLTTFVGLFLIAFYSKIDEIITTRGEVKVIGSERPVKSPMDGEIERIAIKEGDFVKKGAKLIKLKSDIYKEELEKLLKEKELLYEQLSINEELENVYQNAYKEGAISKISLYEILNNRTLIQKNIFENSAMINKNKILTKQTLIRSPEEGFVFNMIPFSRGYVTKFSETLLFIVPNKKIEAKIFIPNSEMGLIQKNMDVEIRIDAFPFTQFGSINGKLSNIGAEALPPKTINDVSKFPAYVKLDQAYIIKDKVRYDLKSGQSLSANIIVRKKRLITTISDVFSKAFDSLRKIK